MGRLLLRRLLVDWGPAVAYMALIWWISSRDVRGVPVDAFPFRDKGIHFVEYTCLGAVVARATLSTWAAIPLRASGLALIATFAWGVLDELHQAFVPGRSADPIDLVADAVGTVCGVLAFWAFRERLRRWRTTRVA